MSTHTMNNHGAAHRPSISVVMPVYNGERYLPAALDSILTQTFTDFEYIIIDDGSSDATWDILTTYADRDPRLRLVRNEQNLGITRSLNKGVQLARGTYVARQDADDISLPQRFARQVAVLQAQPEVVLVSCDFAVIDAHGRQVFQTQRVASPIVTAWYLLFYNRLGGHSQVMFRRDAAIRLNGYTEAFRHNEDYDLWVRLSQIGDIVILPEVLLQWRQHEGSISHRKSTEQRTQTLKLAQAALADYAGTALDLGQVEALHTFWINVFPAAQQTNPVHCTLQAVYHGFLAQRGRRSADVSPLAHELANRIGRQFARWALALFFAGQVRDAVTVAPYAFAWSPFAMPAMMAQALQHKMQRMLLPARLST